MAEYTVIALSVGGGLGKRTFNSGDTVSDDHFPIGRAAELVKKGFLKLKDEEVPIAEEIKSEVIDTPVIHADDNVPNLMAAYDDITIPALKEFLTAKSIEFAAKATKDILYELYTANWNVSTE